MILFHLNLIRVKCEHRSLFNLEEKGLRFADAANT
jgi:hypothetical protein